HERRAFELELWTRAEVVGLETPGDFELIEVAAVDLIERGVPGAANVGGVVRPFAVLRAGHAGRLAGEFRAYHQRSHAGATRQLQKRPSCCSHHRYPLC